MSAVDSSNEQLFEPEMIIIPAGWFQMGCNEHASNESPVHQVWLSPFQLAIYPVTRGEYSRFLEATGHLPPPYWEEPKFQLPDQPVVGTSWYDAIAYCNWMASESGKGYRLPTEAEREKAAQGGKANQDYPFGDSLPVDYRGGRNTELKLVGSEGPNGYGLFNMSEGVHEWCTDWFQADYYVESPVKNPKGPECGERRAARGGSWRHRVRYARCAARSALAPDRTFSDFGFRCALS